MITTLFFLQLLGFLLWHLSSSQIKIKAPKSYVKFIKENAVLARFAGALLVIIATSVFIARMGWMTGLSASLVGLMAVGCLVLVLYPFRYLREYSVIGLYVFFLVLEILL